MKYTLGLISKLHIIKVCVLCVQKKCTGGSKLVSALGGRGGTSPSFLAERARYISMTTKCPSPPPYSHKRNIAFSFSTVDGLVLNTVKYRELRMNIGSLPK